MNPKGLEYHKIEGLNGFFTNVDPSRTPQNYAEDMAGCRIGVEDRVMDRDYGTRHIMAAANYPSGTLVDGAPFYNIDTGNTHHLVAMEDGSGYTQLQIDRSAAGDGSAWLNLTGELCSTTIDGAPSGAVVQLANISGLPTGNDSVIGFIAYNSTDGSYYVISDYVENDPAPGKGKITLLAGTSHGWLNGETVKIYATRYGAFYWDKTIGEGTKTAHFRFAQMDNIRKMGMTIGSLGTTGVITPKRPAILMRRATARNLFYAAGNPLFTQPVTTYNIFDLEPWGGVNLGYTATYGVENPAVFDATYPSTDTYAIGVGGDTYTGQWGVVTFTGYTATVLVGQSDTIGIMMTGVLDDYQETDPFLYAILQSAGFGSDFYFTTKIEIDPARMPRNLTGIRIYSAYNSVSTSVDERKLFFADPANWNCYSEVDLEGQNTNFLLSSQVDWAVTAAPAPQTLYIDWPNNGVNSAVSLGTLADLGRPLLNAEPTEINARFIGMAPRTQSSVIVLDENDSTLRVSAIDGFGAHNEMIFPDVSVDNSARDHKINLIGVNQTMGLSLRQDALFVFRNNEVIMRDLTTGYQRTVPADVYSSRSLVDTPYGICWGGKSAIYIMRSGDIEPKIINGAWLNHYDGRRVYTYADATQYVTDAARSGSIAGYDPYFREYLIQLLTYKGSAASEYLTYRYSFDTNQWSIRYWNVGTSTAQIAFFGIRKDNSLLIGCSSIVSGETVVPALLYYPVTTGLLAFQDLTTSAGATNSKGIRTHAKINLGSITEHVRQGCPHDILMNCHGVPKTSESPTAEIRLYANNNSTAFNLGLTAGSPDDTKPQKFVVPAQSQNVRRAVPNYGPMESMQVRIDITTAQLLNIYQFHLNSLWVGITKNTQRTGNT